MAKTLDEFTVHEANCTCDLCKTLCACGQALPVEHKCYACHDDYTIACNWCDPQRCEWCPAPATTTERLDATTTVRVCSKCVQR